MRRPSSRIPLLPYFFLFLGIAFLTRLGLTLRSGVDAVPPALWPEIFLRGIGFDLAVLAWLLAPAWLLLAIWPGRWQATRWQRGLRLVLFFLASFALLFGALAEATFWEEFSTRFNFIAVDYLIYTHEVIGNVRESYPVGALISGVALLATALTWASRRFLAASQGTVSGWRQRAACAALAFGFPLLSWQLADIDQMQFSQNAYANELVGNGLMTFASAFRRNELDYGRFYATMPAERANQILLDLGTERAHLSVALTPDPNEEEEEAFDPKRLPFKRAPQNVVLISVESLSAKFLGSFGNTKGLTPRLDELASQGLSFTRLYATGTRTVRGLEALTLGTPPIPGQAIVRRPNNEHLATVGQVLRHHGFDTLFLYGGYGYFDNMNAYFAGNDYRVIDRTDFPKSSVGFANVWGVADEYLFDNALAELDKSHQAGKRFLAQIMTTSNHRPYTYPGGRIDIPSPGGRDGAVKYTDYAIGHFIDEARKRSWFKDTVFIIVADHCASAAGKTKLPVNGYHIPLIFYAPDMLPPGQNKRLASQIDIPPTILDVLGLIGDDHFYGESLFEQAQNGTERAFISNYQELGYLKNDHLIVLGPKKRVDYFSIDANGDATAGAADEKLRDEAIAYYQSAFQSFKSGELKLKWKWRD
jgi:phosphoglycerol transferase MdoB-like AlkP superfamily enzyme